MTRSRASANDTDPVEHLRFTIEGVAIPQGSKTVFNGRAVDANKKLKPWRKAVTAAASEALAGRDAMVGPVYVWLVFRLPRPRTVKRTLPHVKPDLDKLVRAMLDGVTDAKVWADDSQVVYLSAKKLYADDNPYVAVMVQPMGVTS